MTDNPRKDDIEGEMQKITVWLNAYNGTKVRDRMNQIWEDGDRGLWNALYWKIDAWLTSWFGRYPLRDSEESIGLSSREASTLRKGLFLHRLHGEGHKGGQGTGWSVTELPRVMAALKEAEAKVNSRDNPAREAGKEGGDA